MIIRTCKYCDKPVARKYSGGKFRGYARTCMSKECLHKNYEICKTRGWKHGEENVAKRQEIRKKISEAMSGCKSHSWKGGKTNTYSHGNNKNSIEYVKVKLRSHPYCDKDGYVREHRLVMEKFLGRYINKNEVVHHINHDGLDNRIENLQLMTRSEHTKLHITKQI